MKMLNIKKSHLIKIILFSGVVFLFAGTLDALISGHWEWRVYGLALVYTATCTFFCTLLIDSFINRIYQYPRIIFYLLFLLFVVTGVFLGVLLGNFLLEQRLRIPWDVLQFSLIVGIVASTVITGYMTIRDQLERKISQLKAVELENERLKRYEAEARFNSLQAKLNPHFLFNMLNTTAALIYEDPPQAEASIVRLSALYRKVLAISNRTFIPLSEEIALIEDLLALEKLRFADNLIFHIECPAALKSHKIPGLLLEPLVENAIKHTQEQGSPLIRIEITIEERDQRLYLQVQDNGPGFDVQKVDPGFGLYSIQERLRLLFGEAAVLEIDSMPGRGTRVSVGIPLNRKG